MAIRKKSLEVICCYAHKDQPLFNKLKAHLTPLQQEGLITLWADVNIDAGTEWEKEIHNYLTTAQIILLLVSPDFMDSEYCYSIEMQRALERHERKEALVIPIILRPVAWQGAPFGQLQVLPTDAIPVTSRKWRRHDEAFLDITKGIRSTAEKLRESTLDNGNLASTFSPTQPFFRKSTGPSRNAESKFVSPQPDVEVMRSSTQSSQAFPDTIPAFLSSGNLYIIGRAERRAAQRVRSALEKYKNKYGPSFSPAVLDARIQLEYVDIANPSDKRSSIVDIYQKNSSVFLFLLGGVGSGKSTSMRELTLRLIESELLKQEGVENINFPIFLPLREWFDKKKPIKVWLAEYLTNREHIHLGLSRQLIQYWAREGKFILLLDGLDDMSEEDSCKCLMAIYKWQRETNSSPLIISCQIDRYEALREDKSFFKAGATAVVIQKLNDSQKYDYLKQKEKPELSYFLYQNEKGKRLKGLIDSPLLLNFLVQATTGKDFEQQISEIDTEDGVYKKYINRYIDDNRLYNGQDARSWLSSLARHMGDNSTFSFQSGNLPKERAARNLYTISTWLILCLCGVAIYILVTSGGFPLWQLFLWLAIIAGFYGYLWKSILTQFYMLLLYNFTLLFPDFSLASSRRKTKRQQVMEFLIALIILFFPLILLVGLSFLLEGITGIPLWLVILLAWLLGGLFWYTFYQLRDLPLFLRLTERSLILETWFALRDLLVFRQVDDPFPLEKPSPKLSRDLIIGMFLGIIVGLMIWIMGRIFGQVNLRAVALLIGLSIWLDRGLGASIRGYLLRFWFWRAKILPWTTKFLDDVARGKILVRQGNRYKFAHNALKEHLAKRASSQK